MHTNAAYICNCFIFLYPILWRSNTVYVEARVCGIKILSYFVHVRNAYVLPSTRSWVFGHGCGFRKWSNNAGNGRNPNYKESRSVCSTTKKKTFRDNKSHHVSSLFNLLVDWMNDLKGEVGAMAELLCFQHVSTADNKTFPRQWWAIEEKSYFLRRSFGRARA